MATIDIMTSDMSNKNDNSNDWSVVVLVTAIVTQLEWVVVAARVEGALQKMEREWQVWLEMVTESVNRHCRL